MFELTEDEVDTVVSQSVIPHKKYLGGRAPFAFTEAGIAMLSSVLKSPQAIAMNIAIMRTFIALRRIASNYKEIMQEIEEMQRQYDGKFSEIYNVLNQLIHPPQPPRRKIGFIRDGNEG